MYKRIDIEDSSCDYIDDYETQEEMIADATRYYHEHFTMDEDYDEDFEVTTYKQAIDFWQANGYEIIKSSEYGRCPICGNKKIFYSESDVIINMYMFYKCYCDKCESTFEEHYKLTYLGYKTDNT